MGRQKAMKNLRLAVNRALTAMGLAGVAGIGFLLFALGICQSSVVPARERLTVLEARAAKAPRLAAAPSTESARGPLSEFYGFFPPLAALPENLARVYAIAEREGLSLAKGEYRLGSSAQAGLTSYQALFPTTGTYVQVRRFVAGVLNEVPNASIDDLRLEKQRAEETVVASQIRLTFYLRAQ
jgi:hypothetical protein